MKFRLPQSPARFRLTTTLGTAAMNAVRSVAARYQWLIYPLLVFLLTRGVVWSAAYYAELAMPSPTSDAAWHALPNNVFLDVWARWDSGFYLGIVDHGYYFEPGQQSSVAFFPVYPLLTSLVKPLAGSTVAAGWLISNLCFLGALIFLYRLTEFEFRDASTARRAIFYLAAFPTSFFFSAIYTESTFLLFAIGAFYFARRQAWAWAVLFGLLCGATRIVGVVMWGVVGLEWLRAQGWTLQRSWRREAWSTLFKTLRTQWMILALICIIPLGLISYMGFLKVKFNDPVAFSTTQAAWQRQTNGPVKVVYDSLASLRGSDFLTGMRVWWHVLLDVGSLIAVLASSVTIWRRLGESYAIYSLLSMLIPASSSTQSLMRYILVVFPFFMLLGVWGKRQWLDTVLITGGCMFLGVLTTIFVNWYFVA
ncbi:MAG: hypothetical protein KF716_14695 [Anaerolineae bacterium]|nr:hypothetical protein [Anaerolineae bacterium]